MDDQLHLWMNAAQHCEISAAGVDASLSPSLTNVRSIAHETADGRERTSRSAALQSLSSRSALP